MDKVAFEAWAEPNGYDLAASSRDDSSWDYQCTVTQELWWCWQAAMAHAKENKNMIEVQESWSRHPSTIRV